MFRIEDEVLTRPPKRQILTLMLQNCETSAVNHSIKKLHCLIL